MGDREVVLSGDELGLGLGYRYMMEGAERKEPEDAAGPPIRVLALHGYTQNGESFAKLSKALRRKLKNIEFTFADAPHQVPRRSKVVIEGMEVEIDNHDREDARCWFYYFREDAAKLPPDFHDPAATRPYHGLDASVTMLTSLWEAQGPFDAVLGFSQGATMTHMLAALGEGARGEGCRAPWSSLKCCVLVAGFPSRSDDRALSGAGGIQLASLHVAGQADQVVPFTYAQELFERFAGPREHYWHGKGHQLPQQAAPSRQIERFLRHHCRGGTGGTAGISGTAGT